MSDVTRLPGAVFGLWDWQSRGACQGVDTELFFHPENARGSARTRRENAAKRICSGCPVLQQCRSHALSAREPYGVWGGLSETDRTHLLAAADAAAASIPSPRVPALTAVTGRPGAAAVTVRGVPDVAVEPARVTAPVRARG